MTVTIKIKPVHKGIETCPTCKRPLYVGNYPRRICAKCKKQITKHDKWLFRLDGKVEHRNCKNPTSYKTEGMK